MIWQAVRGAVLQWSVRGTGSAIMAAVGFYGITWWFAGGIPNVWDELVVCIRNLAMIGDAIYRRDFWDCFDFLWGKDVVPKNRALANIYGPIGVNTIIVARCCLMFAMFTVSFLIAMEALTFVRYGVPSFLHRLWRRWRDRKQHTVSSDGFGGARYESPSDARNRMRQ